VENLKLYEANPDPSQPGTPIHRDFSELDDDGNPIWVEASQFTDDLSAVKAVAIDCTWADEAHTKKFHLDSGETLTTYINMRAPSLEEAVEEGYFKEDAHAYNNASEMTTLIDDVSGFAQENFSVTSDYTKVGLEPYEIHVFKVWDDDDDRDGYRPESITIVLYANNQATENTLVLDERNGWEGTFEDLAYADPNGDKIIYSIKEVPVPDHYRVGIAATDITMTNFVVTNKHTPETVNKEGQKIWSGDEEMYRPAYITVRLYKSVYPYETETLYKTITVRPNVQGYWGYYFEDLPKNEKGKEIHYRIEEKQEGQVLSYITTYDDGNIINTWHPYGDLTVEKELLDATKAASEKTFTFNFYFTDPADGLPVMAKYNYDIIDLNTGVATPSGQVEYGSQVTIRADQKIYVHDIDQYVDYEVTEENTPGFTLTKATGNAGVIKPNETAEAIFKNRYESETSLYLKARKRLENHELLKYQFHFEVYRDKVAPENLIRTASSGDQDQIVPHDDGTVQYSSASVLFGAIRFSHLDDGCEYTFVIKEKIPDDADDQNKYKGYTYDPTEYTVRIRVEDNGDGTMTIKYLDENGQEIDPPATADFNEDFRFNNIYEAEGKVQLRVWKDLQGRKIKAGEFSFEMLNSKGESMLDEDGNPIIASNDENGVVTFPEIKYDQSDIGKTYYYAFREIPGSDDTVIYTDAVFGYQVVVSDNGDGTLSTVTDKATPAITKDEAGTILSIDWDNWTTEGAELPVFVNPMEPGNLSVTKLISEDSEDYDPSQKFHFFVQLIGEDIPDGEWEYELTQVGQSGPAPVNPGSDEPGQDAPDPADSGNEEEAEDEAIEEDEDDEDLDDANGFGTIMDKVSSFFGMNVYGETGGTYAGVDWTITEDGTLILGNGDSQTYSGTSTAPVWTEYADDILKVETSGTIVIGQTASYMFSGLTKATSIDLSGFITT
jgi:hypothetical protein